MIARKFLGLPNLTKTQAFCGYEIEKVIMIGKNENFMLAIF